MTFRPVPDCAQAVIEWQYAATTMKWTNTFWFQKPGFTVADMDDLANDLQYWCNENLTSIMATGVVNNKVTVYDMRDELGPKVQSSLAGQAGGQGGETIPPTLALVITLRTGSRGRSGRGRHYLTGFALADQDVGSLAVSARNVCVTAYNALLATQPTGWSWVVVQRSSGGAYLAEGVPRAITSIEARSDIWASQRRRVHRP